MRRLAVVCALLAWSVDARGDEPRVALEGQPGGRHERQIRMELQALGHEVGGAEVPPPRVGVWVESTADGGRVTLDAPQRPRVVLRFDARGWGDPTLVALRVVEGVRGLLLRGPVAPVARAAPPRSWTEALHGAVALGASLSAGGVAPAPLVHLRGVWEGPVWISLVAELGLSESAADESASLWASTFTIGVGAALVRGPRGALGIAMRGGVAVVDARALQRAIGAVGYGAGALTGRVNLWRRLSLYASASVGTTLAEVQLIRGDRVVAEWGRPHASLVFGLSY